MPTFAANFFTEADWAETEFRAETPADALRQAHEMQNDKLWMLDFQSYDNSSGVEHIEICDANGATVAEWRSPELLCRLAANNLRAALEAQTEAAQAVIDAWATGDLAGAVRMLNGSLPAARAALTSAKGG